MIKKTLSYFEQWGSVIMGLDENWKTRAGGRTLSYGNKN